MVRPFLAVVHRARLGQSLHRFGEGGGTAGADAGGVPDGTGHGSGFGVDVEVVAVVAVFDVGFADDGFGDGGEVVLVEGFEGGTGPIRRVGNNLAVGGLVGNEVGNQVGVGVLAPVIFAAVASPVSGSAAICAL